MPVCHYTRFRMMRTVRESNICWLGCINSFHHPLFLSVGFPGSSKIPSYSQWEANSQRFDNLCFFLFNNIGTRLPKLFLGWSGVSIKKSDGDEFFARIHKTNKPHPSFEFMALAIDAILLNHGWKLSWWDVAWDPETAEVCSKNSPAWISWVPMIAMFYPIK